MIILINFLASFNNGRQHFYYRIAFVILATERFILQIPHLLQRDLSYFAYADFPRVFEYQNNSLIYMNVAYHNILRMRAERQTVALFRRL